MPQFNSLVFILMASLFVSSSCLDIHQPEYTRYGQRPQYGHTYQPGMYHQISALDESYHTPLDYHYPQAHKNYGQVVRRSSPALGIRQIPCSLAQQQQNVYRCYRSIPTPSVPLYPVCNIHDHPRVNSNEGTRLNLLPRYDSRNVIDLSRVQYNEDVAQQSPMISPKYLSNPTIKFNDANDEGATQQNRGTIIYDRLIPNKNSDDSNKEEENSRRSTGGVGEFNNTNILVENVRAAESNGGKVYYPTDGRTYLTHIGPQKSLKNPLAASSDTSTYSEQPPTYAFVPQPISRNKAEVTDKPNSPNKYLDSIQSADSLPSLLKSSLPTNNKRQYPIYTPVVVQKNSTKHP